MSVNSYDHLPPSIQRLIVCIEEKQTGITPGLARDFVLEANISSRDVMPWSDFGHPHRDGYGRKLVYDGGFFEIMVMSWVPGDFSAIHDHGTAQWGAVESFGEAEHAVFALREGRLETRVRCPFRAGEVYPVTHELIHQMGNPDRAPFCSLHLYGSYDHKGDVTGDSRIYDLWADEIQLVTGGVFFCLPDDQISRRDRGVPADFPTELRHHTEMLRRIAVFLPHLEPNERDRFRDTAQAIRAALFDEAGRNRMADYLGGLRDESGQVTDTEMWRLLWHEVDQAQRLIGELRSDHS